MGKLTLAKNFVTSSAGRQLLKTQKNSPVLLFTVGVVGFAGTVVLASKATLRLESVLSENERKVAEATELARADLGYSEKDHARDLKVLKTRLILDVTKLYAPAVGVGFVSIAALTGSHVILSKRNTSLMAAYAALDKATDEYRARVAAFVGADKERELRFSSETREVAVDGENGTEIQNHTGIVNEGPHSQYAKLFGRDSSQSWSERPEYNLMFLRAQQNWANDTLQAKGHLFLNEVYDNLGLERTTAGQVVGWVKNNKRGGDNFVDFGIFNGESIGTFVDFFSGREGAILLDFNVDGIVHDLI